METKKDLLNIERDIPTTPEDIRALRENRPQPAEDWLTQLTIAVLQIPNLQELRRKRRTLEGFDPFEL
ncbi:MAG TPA: hypothetical protein VLB76_16670 [Thermoanaerobaculia bacterium]|jgi:hypothetical protein|nr:hypothetical protein [Thermoanaerobaculia bacterium]